MSGFMIVICIMLVMFAMLAIVIVRDPEERVTVSTSGDLDDGFELQEKIVVDGKIVAIEESVQRVEFPPLDPGVDQSTGDTVFTAEEISTIDSVIVRVNDPSMDEYVKPIHPAQEAEFDAGERVSSVGEQAEVIIAASIDEPGLEHESESAVTNHDDRRPEQPDDV